MARTGVGATAPKIKGDQEKLRRLPEKGEKFVLAGPDFVTPVLFTMDGEWEAGEVKIRMCDARDFPMLDPNARGKEARGYQPPSKPADPQPVHFHTDECNHG